MFSLIAYNLGECSSKVQRVLKNVYFVICNKAEPYLINFDWTQDVTIITIIGQITGYMRTTEDSSLVMYFVDN